MANRNRVYFKRRRSIILILKSNFFFRSLSKFFFLSFFFLILSGFGFHRNVRGNIEERSRKEWWSMDSRREEKWEKLELFNQHVHTCPLSKSFLCKPDLVHLYTKSTVITPGTIIECRLSGIRSTFCIGKEKYFNSIQLQALLIETLPAASRVSPLYSASKSVWSNSH